MTMNKKEETPRLPIKDWEAYYKETATEELPWYSVKADPEMIDACKNFCPPPPRAKVLDIGTGPGTMAIEFARMGYNVTACDISRTALDTAKRRAGLEGLDDKITFRICDIREGLTDRFDIINDRGCFHVMRGADREKYIDTISALTRPGGVVLLKTFSTREPGPEGPQRYSVEDIREIFSDGFDLIFSCETVFQSTMETNPKAILCVLKRKD